MVIGIQPDKSELPHKCAFILIFLPGDEVYKLTPMLECEELFEYANKECPGLLQEWELDGVAGDCREKKKLSEISPSLALSKIGNAGGCGIYPEGRRK